MVLQRKATCLQCCARTQRFNHQIILGSPNDYDDIVTDTNETHLIVFDDVLGDKNEEKIKP